MSSEEKAKELLSKFELIERKHPWQYGLEEFEAKQCALICVDEIMKDIDNYSLESTDESYRLDKLYFWQQVKQEIKNY